MVLLKLFAVEELWKSLNAKVTDGLVSENALPPPVKGVSWAKWALRLALSVAILFFLVRYLYLSWRSASAYEWHFSPVPLSLSLVALLMAQGLAGACWHLIFHVLGTTTSLRASYRALLLGQLAKYVPGKVLTLVARVHLMKAVGVRGETTLAAQVIEVAALCVSGVAVGAVFGLGSPQLLSNKGFHGLLLVVPLGLMAMHPVVLQRPVAFAARKLGRRAVRLRVAYGSLLAITFCYAFVWIAFGIGVYCLSAAVSAAPGHLWTYVGAYALAWVAGFVSFLTPAGLGVREAAFAALLSPQLGAAPAIALALLARLWVTAGEIVCAAAVSNFRLRALLPHSREPQ